MDFRHPYLTRQLIAYIGNKRALLPFLFSSFSALAEGRGAVSFCDPFSGSGAVSRLARLMGFTVAANDWEPYSYVINSCYLGIGAREIAGLFGDRGGLQAVLDGLNALDGPPEDACYISRHYAPARTQTADWRKERLFYTTENALILDAIRDRIEAMYPGTPAGGMAFKEKMVLLAPLLYEAATHTNTSGVFKACHRGFGGHGGDALSRIMAPIRLVPPVLADSPSASSVSCEDAARFLASHSADICYLDPPYASHQYGSNYFMLNTLALWDKPDVSDARSADGRLKEKAGIRKDWVRTRSEFCYRATAAHAFRRIVQAADCRHLCVSYSDEGILDLVELAEILSETGRLALYGTDYVTYPGGRQSIRRTTRNAEVLMVVDRGSMGGKAGGKHAEELLLKMKLEKLLRSSFNPRRIRESFRAEGEAIVFEAGCGETVRLPMAHWYRFTGGLSPSPACTRELIPRLQACLTRDRREEIEVLLGILEGGGEERMTDYYLQEILRLLKGIAHRKYRDVLEETLEKLQAFAVKRNEAVGFREGLARIERTAEKRFGFSRGKR